MYFTTIKNNLKCTIGTKDVQNGNTKDYKHLKVYIFKTLETFIV